MRKFLGIPYKKRGRDYKGADCYGLVYLFYKDYLDIELPLFDLPYMSLKQQSNCIEECKGQFLQVTTPKKYDIILIKRGNYRLHVGIYIDKHKILHITKDIKYSAITSLREYELCEKEYFRWY